MPPHLDRAAIDEIPDTPGVYLFYDDGAAPLYVGKSRAMRSRVLQHFIATASWTPRVRRIEWQRTAGELGALLREAELVKELDPVYNRQLRRPGRLCGFAFDGRRLRLAGADEIDADTLPFVYGVWRSRRAALQALRAAADEHRLCLQTLGFDVKKKGICLRHQLGRCAGVCAGKESIHVHHARVATALARLKHADWPHRGPLAVVEEDSSRDATEVHVLDRWCYLGTATSDAEVAELLEARRPRFDYDHYRILSRHLGKRGVRVVQLARLMHCELVVPGLFATGATARFAALELLLARGRSRAAPAQRLEDWLHEAFDLGRSIVPAGALTLLAHGGDPGERSLGASRPGPPAGDARPPGRGAGRGVRAFGAGSERALRGAQRALRRCRLQAARAAALVREARRSHRGRQSARRRRQAGRSAEPGGAAAE